MAQYIVQIPQAYRARVGGNARITVEATSSMGAKIAAGQYGIPGAALQLPVKVQGDVSSGSLPPTPGGTLDPANNPVYRNAVGANSYTSQPMGELEYYADGSPKSTGQNTSVRRDASGRMVFGSTEESSGNNFAPNINPAPSIQQQQQATPFQIGGANDPFSQPPAYQRLTPEYFAKLRKETAKNRRRKSCC